MENKNHTFFDQLAANDNKLNAIKQSKLNKIANRKNSPESSKTATKSQHKTNKTTTATMRLKFKIGSEKLFSKEVQTSPEISKIPEIVKAPETAKNSNINSQKLTKQVKKPDLSTVKKEDQKKKPKKKQKLSRLDKIMRNACQQNKRFSK